MPPQNWIYIGFCVLAIGVFIRTYTMGLTGPNLPPQGRIGKWHYDPIEMRLKVGAILMILGAALLLVVVIKTYL
jgi:hypothetical protein